MKQLSGLFTLTALIFSIITVAGCGTAATQPTKHTEKQPPVEYSFEVEQEYQAVYHHILEQLRACKQPEFTAKMLINDELHTDSKTADISLVLSGLFSNTPYLNTKIESIAENKSRISVSNKLPRWNNMAQAVKSWVVDGSTDCGNPTKP